LRYHRKQAHRDWKDFYAAPKSDIISSAPCRYRDPYSKRLLGRRARWGSRQPIEVEAVPGPADSPAAKNVNYAERDAALSNDEALNVRIYRQSSAAVANILTKATNTIFGWIRFR
jgi:hypothetical protein